MGNTIAVIIPANNEERYIDACLKALLAQDCTRTVDIIVAANACTDQTVPICRSYAAAAQARGWTLEVLDLAEGGKLNALNQADAIATAPTRAYLDADVVLSPPLLGQICDLLDRPDPAYASGTLAVASAKTWATRAYARVWVRTPFMTQGVPGAGFFAVNAAGRARWGAFPDIISDDTFVRLSFAPEERHKAPATYTWPMVEGVRNLVRVRARQDLGVEEVAKLYPQLMKNEGKSRFGFGRLVMIAVTDPIGLCLYIGVALAVRRRKRKGAGWTRGR